LTVHAPDRGLIVVMGVCPSEDAEVLLQRLLATPTATVDLSACEALHAAVIQVLLASAPNLRLPLAESESGLKLRSLLRSVLTAKNSVA